MADKSSGFDFDRQVFIQSDTARSRPATPIAGILIALAAIAGIAFLAYKLLPQTPADSSQSDSVNSAASLAEVNDRLSDIEKRLDRLESVRRTAIADRRGEHDHPAQGKNTAQQLYSTGSQTKQVVIASGQTKPDAATMQRLSAVQRGVVALESNETADREAWQATTNKMADMAGQVGSQSVEELRNRDELNELLAVTEMDAIPFELYRGANPQPVGPVALGLKSVSVKHQRYTICVYIQNSCTELKNRILHEVVQFVVTKNGAPLRVVGTKISDDEMVGYLEVPRSQSSQ